jgi:hypothetical protein
MERIITLTTCDKCQPSDMYPRYLREARGVTTFTSDIAVQEHGWLQTDFGLICPDCLREEAEELYLDEVTGVVFGPLSNVGEAFAPVVERLETIVKEDDNV